MIKKAKKSDHLHFSVDSGSLIFKEKASSTTIIHKLFFSKLVDIVIIGGELAIGFVHGHEAWIMLADKPQDLTTWAKSIIHLAEEAVKQTEAISFPPFDAADSFLTVEIDFATDVISYEYEPLTYAKKRAMTMQAFDLSSLKLDDETPAPGAPTLKRERSIEVLSDDD